VSITGLSDAEIMRQAEQGDLRPQFNPHAVITWPVDSRDGLFDRSAVRQALSHRFFELSRPIADGCREPGLNMRLGDAGRFFYLIETLQRLGYDSIEQTLLVLLDEFSLLEQRSYDELYLWSIVELSRRNPEYVDTFWPMALTLDLRFRSASWKRLDDRGLVDWPYRLTELVMYFYVHYTTPRQRTDELRPRAEHDQLPEDFFRERIRQRRRREPEEQELRLREFHHVMKRHYLPLATCLRRVLGQLSEEQTALLMDTLRELARHERRPAFGDAHGLLFKEMR
jgi:hypothetical protein